jgi:hypothetical protein
MSRAVRLGAYEIVALVGSGRMGEVYRARDPRLGRDVAVDGRTSVERDRQLAGNTQEMRSGTL